MNLSRNFWMAFRQALLMMLDALERELQISPRTAELRKQSKESKILSTDYQPERSAMDGDLMMICPRCSREARRNAMRVSQGHQEFCPGCGDIELVLPLPNGQTARLYNHDHPHPQGVIGQDLANQLLVHGWHEETVGLDEYCWVSPESEMVGSLEFAINKLRGNAS